MVLGEHKDFTWINGSSGWIDKLKREKFWVGRCNCIDRTSITCFDVAAKCFQVSTQLHSSPVMGWLRSSRSSISCRSHSLEDLVKDIVSDECFLQFNQILD